MTIDEFLKKLSDLSGCSLEFLIRSGYSVYAQELIDADIELCPDDAWLYLQGALGVVEMVEEDTGIKILEHGFTFKPSIDEGVLVSRVATVSETPGLTKYFKNPNLAGDDLVTIEFEGDINLFTVQVQDQELESQATHEPSGAKCLKKILGFK